MARKTAMFTIEEEGRDKGKVFRLSEMPAAQGEEWAMKVLFALMNANVEIPDNAAELGMAGMAEVGLKGLGKLSFDVAKPLLGEMFECVTIIPDPSKTHVHRPLVDSDIEEIGTRLKLRMEVLNLHVDFSQAVAGSTSRAGATAPNRAARRATRTSQKS